MRDSDIAGKRTHWVWSVLLLLYLQVPYGLVDSLLPGDFRSTRQTMGLAALAVGFLALLTASRCSWNPRSALALFLAPFLVCNILLLLYVFWPPQSAFNIAGATATPIYATIGSFWLKRL